MSRAVWVTRDNSVFGTDYNLHIRKPAASSFKDGGWSTLVLITLCGHDFERVTGFRLKPGEGPVKVRIEVKRVKQPRWKDGYVRRNPC